MTAAQLLDLARAELGVTESPPGSNNVKYNTWYYRREVEGAYPWCMVFVQWLFAQGDVKPPLRTASCGTLMGGAKKKGQWVTEGYRPGDVLIYDFPGGAKTDHCGICEAFDGKTVTAIEGNTSPTSAANGGKVLRMKRDAALVRGAWRPDYQEEEIMNYETFQQFMARYLEELSALPPKPWGEEWEEARRWAEEEGIIRGDGAGEKMYCSLPTRQQLVLFLYRFKDLI